MVAFTSQTFAAAAVKVDDAIPTYTKSSGVSGNLSSVGSDTLANLMTLWAEEFKREYPNVNIQIQAAGSSTAPPALTEGTSNLGPMSRKMKDKEEEAFEKKFGYPVTTSTGQKKHILVKIRRNPKMNSLFQAIQADIHQNMEPEYKSLRFVHDYFSGRQDDFGAIRPLDFIKRYQAIVMEENPSRTLRRLLAGFHSSKTDWDSSELRDAARKTGRWLYYFHQRLNSSFNKDYTTGDILQEARDYAQRIESVSRHRVLAGSIMDAFSKKLENIHIEQVTFSHTHSDMTTDRIL